MVTAHLFPFILAYIDPSTGGFLFQILAVVFTMISGLILLFSNQIKALYYRLRGRSQPGSENADGAATSADDAPGESQ